MKRITILAAAAALLAAPAVFAQVAATATVVEGGPVLLEGPATSRPIHGAVIAEAPVVVAPGAVAVVPSGVAIAPATTVLGGPAAVVAAAPNPPATIVQHYWNVPADIGSRMDFQRWRRLM